MTTVKVSEIALMDHGVFNSKNNKKFNKKKENHQRGVFQISNLCVAKYFCFISIVHVLDENCKKLWRMLSGRVPPSPPLSKDGVIKEIGHIMSIENLSSGVNNVTVLYMIMTVY